MRHTCSITLFTLLFFICFTKSEVSKDERVVLVSPVLAPYRNARVQTNETAKDFPLLMLLASDDAVEVSRPKIDETSAVQQTVYVKDSNGQLYVTRLKRQNPPLGDKNYMQASAVQPSVVVMSSGVPNTVYRGVPSSGYGVQRSPYGVNGAPTVVVNMPDDNYITPMAGSQYVVPSRRY